MWMLLIPLVNIFYEFLNNSSRGVYSLVTDLDNAIPFLKIFAIPYLMWYPFIIITLIYLCLNHRKIYYKAIATLVIGMLLSYLTFFLFQTTVPRPQLSGDDILTKIVQSIYGRDKPYNCFPSIHVLNSYAIMIGIRKSKCKNGVINVSVYITGLLIILSTVFIKQHVILDVFLGLQLAEMIYRTVDNFSVEKWLGLIKKISSWWMSRKKQWVSQEKI